MSMWTNAGFASYNGGTLSLRKLFSKGFSFDFNYTLSHSMTTAAARRPAAVRPAASC